MRDRDVELARIHSEWLTARLRSTRTTRAAGTSAAYEPRLTIRPSAELSCGGQSLGNTKNAPLRLTSMTALHLSPGVSTLGQPMARRRMTASSLCRPYGARVGSAMGKNCAIEP
jgi:hypothetical protein